MQLVSKSTVPFPLICMFTKGSALFTRDLEKKLVLKFYLLIRFLDTHGLCSLFVSVYAEEGSLGLGDWAHRIYSRLSVSWSPSSDIAMVMQPLLFPQLWGPFSESLVLALPKCPCCQPGTRLRVISQHS